MEIYHVKMNTVNKDEAQYWIRYSLNCHLNLTEWTQSNSTQENKW